MNIRISRSDRGFSLLELLAVVAIVGAIAGVALVSFRSTSDTAKKRACYVTKGEIDVQVRLWYRDKGTWPQNTLGDIGTDTAYFPSGLPTCPLDGSTYSLDSSTHRVLGHTH